MKTVYKIDQAGKKELMKFGTYSNARKFVAMHFGTLGKEVTTTNGLDEIYNYGTYSIVIK